MKRAKYSQVICQWCGGDVPTCYANGKPMSPAHHKQRMYCGDECLHEARIENGQKRKIPLTPAAAYKQYLYERD